MDDGFLFQRLFVSLADARRISIIIVKKNFYQESK